MMIILQRYFKFATLNQSVSQSRIFRNMDVDQSIIWGETPAPGGDPNSKKFGIFGGIKLQIFGAEGAENFEKLRFLMENYWLLLEF